MSADRRVRREKTNKGNGKAVFSGSVPGPGRGGSALGAAGGGSTAAAPGGKDGSARGRGPRVGGAAHLPCDPAGGGAGLPGRCTLSFAAAGRQGGCRGAGAALCGPARQLDGPGLCAGHGAHLRLGGPESEERMARQRVTYYK